MAKRNIIWLVVILAVGVLGWVVFSIVIGLIAAVAMLIVSEVVERRARAKRRSAQRSGER